MRSFLLILVAIIVVGCNRHGGEEPKPELPRDALTKETPFTVEDARTALIERLKGDPGETKGPATFLKSAKSRDRLRGEVSAAEISEAGGVHYIAGFEVSVADKWYSITLTGAGFSEDYRGAFRFEGNRWKATPPELRAIACWK